MSLEKLASLKRIKQLFLVFLKQFRVDEYKLLLQFLQILINKYSSNSDELFELLKNQISEDEGFLVSSPTKIRKQLNLGSSKNRRYQQKHIKQTRSSFPVGNSEKLSSPLIYAQNQLDEEMNIRFDGNDDDTDIDYLDENYNEPLGPCNIMHSNVDAFNLDMLKDRTDILDSFLMKQKEEDYNDCELEENINDREYLNENEEFYYDNYEDEAYGDEYLSQAYEDDQHNKQKDIYDRNYGIASTYSHHTESAEFRDDIHEENFVDYQTANHELAIQRMSFKTKIEDEKSKLSLKNNNTSNDYGKYKTEYGIRNNTKPRVRKFSEAIRSELERKFLLNNFISGVEKSQLAKKLELTERQVQKWFVHRREKLRRIEKQSAISICQTENAIEDEELMMILNAKPNEHMTNGSLTGNSPNSSKTSNQNKHQIQSRNSAITEFRSKLDQYDNPYKKFYLKRSKLADQSHSSLLSQDKKINIKVETSELEMHSNSALHDETELQNQSNESFLNECHNVDEFVYEDYEKTDCFTDNEANSRKNAEYNEKTNYQNMEGDTSSLMFEDTDGLAYSQFISSNFDESSNQGYEVDETNTIDLASSEVRFGSAPVVKRKCLSVPRRLFPLEVVTHLESLFDMDKYIKESQIEEICKITSLNEKQIRSWFKQRRFRYNLENKEKDYQDYEMKTLTSGLSKQIVNELEKAFEKNNYVYGHQKKHLSRHLNLTPVELERWFYHRRRRSANGS